jgi:ribA/ribD-fused uncharacterized protein
MVKNGFSFFWSGTYSQWNPSVFTIDGITYTSCEQYMMAKKALMFNDLVAYAKIMGTDNPRSQKAFGREVKGFNKELWEAHCRKIVFDANYAKFTQNDAMRRELLDDEFEIAEASPEDSIWGIGLRESDPLAWDRATWKGSNWLGIALMQVRDKIIIENS